MSLSFRHHRTTIVYLISMALLGSLLAACASGTSAPLPQGLSPTATQTHTLTSGLDPVQAELSTRFAGLDQIATKRALTPSPTTTITLTRAPTRTATIYATGTPAPTGAPLATDGPWLLSYQYPIYDWVSRSYSLQTLNGTNPQPVNLPPLPEDRFWWHIDGGNGTYLAFRAIRKNVNPNDLRPNGFDDGLWIIKLPENKVIRSIPLLGKSAWERTQAELIDMDVELELAPILLGLISDSDTFLWSPNGRYLAFSAAVESASADIYLFDTQSEQVRRLTFSQRDAKPWLWSADNNLLIFQEATNYEIGLGLHISTSAVFVTDLDHNERLLYQPEGYEWALDATDRDFLVMNTCFECDQRNFRKVNFLTGEISTVFSGWFPDLAYDPVSGTILLNFSSSFSWINYSNDLNGIFQINAPDQLGQIMSGKYDHLQWSPELSLFSASTAYEENPTQNDLIFFTPSGRITITVTNTFLGRYFPSPNGRWIIIEHIPPLAEMTEYHLYDSAGNFITVLQGEPGYNEPIWFKDSTGFIFSTCGGGCFVNSYRQSNQWTAEPLVSSENGSLYVEILYPNK